MSSATEAEPPGLTLHFQVLERTEQVQHGAVIHRERVGGRVAPGRARLAAFQEREPVGIEQVAAVGRQLHPLVLHAAVDGPEGGQQADPGVQAALQNLFAVLVGGFLKLGHERRDGVVLVVERITQKQEFPFLGAEQEHQPHHHRQRRLI